MIKTKKWTNSKTAPCVMENRKNGFITVRYAMQELKLKPNTLYRRVKELYYIKPKMSTNL